MRPLSTPLMQLLPFLEHEMPSFKHETHETMMLSTKVFLGLFGEPYNFVAEEHTP